MSSDYLRGTVLTPPYSVDHQLASIAADLVEIKHELKLQGGTLYQQAETLRQLTLQLKVLEIQIGLLRERLPK